MAQGCWAAWNEEPRARKAGGSNGAEKAYVEQPTRCPPSPWPAHLGTQSQGRTVAVLTSAAFLQTAFLPAGHHPFSGTLCPQEPCSCAHPSPDVGGLGQRVADDPGAGHLHRLSACICPRMLCLAGGTSSRLPIKDSAAEAK